MNCEEDEGMTWKLIHLSAKRSLENSDARIFDIDKEEK